MPGSPASFALFTAVRHDWGLCSSPENSSDAVSFSPCSPFYMLRYHRDRMLEAAQHFEWTDVAQRLGDGSELEALFCEEVQSWRSRHDDEKSPLKVRVLFDCTGHMRTDMAPTPAVPLSSLYPAAFITTAAAVGQQQPVWTLTVDAAPTPTSSHTLLKTTQRAPYDAALARSVPAAPVAAGSVHEVLLWNAVGEMTEGSFTSVYFYRGGRWVTPPVGLPDNVWPLPRSGGDGTTVDEGELRAPFPGRWGHSVRSVKAVAGAGGQRGTTRRWALQRGLCMEEPVARQTVEVGERVWVSNGVRGFGLGVVVDARLTEQ